MTMQSSSLTICRPDDWHTHFRDGEILKTVVPYTSKIYGRALVMPNLIPPITTIESAIAYRQRIIEARPLNHNFTPLMTCYVTDSINPKEIEYGFNEGIFSAAKLYPFGTTINSSNGATSINAIIPLLERMERIGMPLLLHGEIAHANIDIFDREARFIDEVMEPLHKQFPELKIVLEHISTKEAAEYVRDGNEYLAATVTPQHLMFNRNHMLADGIRPHLYCLPILKREIHQKTLRKLATSGFKRIFLGTDSAPHSRNNKENNCGCAGCFSSPSALSSYAMVFEEMNALEHLEAFCSINGPHFYGFPINNDTIVLKYEKCHVPPFIATPNDDILVPFLAKEKVHWTIKC